MADIKGILNKVKDVAAMGLLGIDTSKDNPALVATGALMSGDFDTFKKVNKMRFDNMVNPQGDAEYQANFPNTQKIDPVTAGLGFAPMGLATKFYTNKDFVVNSGFGDVLPDSNLYTKLKYANYKTGVVNGSPSLTVRSLPDGKYLANYSPLWGEKSKPFAAISENVDELINDSLKRIKKSDSLINSHELKKHNNSLEGMLNNEFGDVFKIKKSERSSSKYLIHEPSGTKIRISDHDLPLGYESADLDLPINLTNNELFEKIKLFLK